MVGDVFAYGKSSRNDLIAAIDKSYALIIHINNFTNLPDNLFITMHLSIVK